MKKMRSKLRYKLASKTGETITEVLVSILMIALSFLFLASAVTAAARINETMDNKSAAFHVSGTILRKRSTVYQVEVKRKGADAGITIPANLYSVPREGTDNGHYLFYEYANPAPPPP